MKKLGFIISVIILLFIQACGFSPLLKESSFENVKIKKIKYTGPNELVYFLRSNLNIPISRTSKNGYFINIDINERLSSVTKNTAGVTTQESIMISLKVNILDVNNNVIGKESLSDSKTVSITNNISTDAEIKRIEKENIVINLIEELTFAIRAKIISSKK